MKLFRKPKSKFYWYDFTVRGQRYRGSTQETKVARAATLASLKLAQVVDGTDPLPRKAPVLLEFSRRFLDWLEEVRLEDKTKTYYRDGWRLLGLRAGNHTCKITCKKPVLAVLKRTGAVPDGL